MGYLDRGGGGGGGWLQKEVTSSNFSSELHTAHTADGRVIGQMFNGTNGCTLFNCKFSHVCNLKLKACGQNHPSYKHGS